MLIRYQC